MSDLPNRRGALFPAPRLSLTRCCISSRVSFPQIVPYDSAFGVSCLAKGEIASGVMSRHSCRRPSLVDRRQRDHEPHRTTNNQNPEGEHQQSAEPHSAETKSAYTGTPERVRCKCHCRASGSLEVCNHTLQPGSGFHGNLMRY